MMKINKERKSAESPDQAPHGKTRVSRRVMLAAILLALSAGIAVPSGLLTKVERGGARGCEKGWSRCSNEIAEARSCCPPV